MIKACILSDRSMQNLLYKKFAAGMYGVCLRYARNRQDAEDMLQEGFIKVFGCIHQYNFKGSLEGWIRKIMVNCALQKIKSRQVLYPLSLAGITENITDGNLPAYTTIKELLEMIHRLPDMCRLVFNLHVFENMKHIEIAALLNISEGTSKSNLHDARKILQQKLHSQHLFTNIMVAHE